MNYYHYQSDSEIFKEYLDILVRTSTLEDMRRGFMTKRFNITEDIIDFKAMPLFTKAQVEQSRKLKKGTEPLTSRSDIYRPDIETRMGRKIHKWWIALLKERGLYDSMDETQLNPETFINQYFTKAHPVQRVQVTFGGLEGVLYIRSVNPVKPSETIHFKEIDFITYQEHIREDE